MRYYNKIWLLKKVKLIKLKEIQQNWKQKELNKTHK